MGYITTETFWKRRKYWMTPDTVCMGDSRRCVYEWYHNGEVFYVGQGKNDRFRAACNGVRSPEFMNVYNQGRCRVEIIAYGMTEREARDMERERIDRYKKEGRKLVNRQYVIVERSPKQIAFMQALIAAQREGSHGRKGGTIRQYIDRSYEDIT